MDSFLNYYGPFYFNNTINLRRLTQRTYIVLQPQNGDRIVTTDSVTSLHSMFIGLGLNGESKIETTKRTSIIVLPKFPTTYRHRGPHAGGEPGQSESLRGAVWSLLGVAVDRVRVDNIGDAECETRRRQQTDRDAEQPVRAPRTTYTQ